MLILRIIDNENEKNKAKVQSRIG